MTKWENATWYTATFTPSPVRHANWGGGGRTPFRTKTKKHVSLDEWVAAQKNRVYFLPNEDWSEFTYAPGDYEARSIVVPEGDEVYEYLTGSEYIRMWDHLTSFDTQDLVNAGVDFTAYSKVFKVICAHEYFFEDIESAIQKMWAEHKGKTKMNDSIDARFKYVYDKKSIKKDEKLRGAQSIVFSRDLKKRYDLISNRLTNGDNSTEVFRLVMASLLSHPEPFEQSYIERVAEVGEKHGGAAVFNMVVDGIDFDLIEPMLDYGIDRELASSMLVG